MSIESKTEALLRFDRQADALIERTKQSGRYGNTQAASSYRQVIEQTRIAYQESLFQNYEADRLENNIFTALDSISGEINDGMPSSLATRSMIISNLLPYSTDRPFVTAITPNVVWAHITSFSLKVIGYFPLEARDATLQINEGFDVIPLTSYSEHQLTFIVNRPTLPTNITTSAIFTTSQLFIPWIDRLGRRTNGIFKLNIGILPPQPAAITFNYQVRRDIPKQPGAILSQGVTIHSQKGPKSNGPYIAVGGNDDQDLTSYFRPSPGWRIDLNTLQKFDHRRDGDCSGPDFVHRREDEVAVRGITKHKTWGCSGIILYEIRFQEYQPARWVADNKTDKYPLKREGSRRITLPRGALSGWNGTIQLFNANIPISHQTAPPRSNYFKIHQESGQAVWRNFTFILKAIPLEEIEGTSEPQQNACSIS